MSFTLTSRQAELLDFIKHTIDETGTAPNYDEMAAAIGLNSKSGIHRLMCGLERRGKIRRIAGIPRAIEVVAAVNSYDESRALLREAAEKLDALTLMLRSMKEARNGTALDMDGDELFGFVLPHESYMNAHMILNDAAWFARITAHLEAGK